MKIILFSFTLWLMVTFTSAFEVKGNYTDIPDLSGVTDDHLIIKQTKISKLENDVFSEVPQITSLTILSNPLSSIEEYAFRGLKNLHHLDMGYNLLRAIPNLSSICKTLETLVLSLNYISAIDVTKLANCEVLTTLNLNQNQITEIPNTLLASGRFSSKLKELDLSDNMITKIQKDAFTGLDSLEILNLAKNDIQSIENFNLKSVQNLNLKQNAITSIPDNLFKESVMAILDLSKNDQVEIIPDLSYVRSTLKTLSLNQMGISDIPYGKLINMTALRVLNMNSNKLQAFGNVTSSSLTQLNLEYNQIATLSGDDLKELKNIVTLNLKKNLITKMPMFPQEMPALRNLKMSYNKVRLFTTESFKFTPLIEYIDLSNNELEGFPNISSLPTMKELLVGNNGLREFSAENVAGLKDCTVLHLGNNLLSVFPNVSLIKGILLELYINNNSIKELDPMMLTGPDADLSKIVAGDIDSGVTMQKLDASSTNVTRISDEFLHVANKLTHITMTNGNLAEFPDLTIIKKTLAVASFGKNNINAVPSAALQGMSELQTLTLNNNHLKSFPFEVIASMTKLKTLNLAGNDLTTLPVLTSYDTRLISLTLKVTWNPLTCDRGLCWLKDGNLNKINIALSDSPCSTPASLTAKKWTEMTFNDLQCNTTPPIVTGTFYPKSDNGERMWSRSDNITLQMTSQTARSKSDCGRQCMARLLTWKLTGCSGFKYVPGVENNCILYV